MQEKQCTKCGEVKGVDKFHPAPGYRYGVASWCKTCRSEYAANRINPITVNRKQCQRCDVVKPAGEFYRGKRNRDGIQHACKDCMNERDRLRESARRAARPPRPPRTTPTEKRCVGCEAVKSVGEFYLRGPHRDGGQKVSSSCKPCSRNESREWARSNPDRRKMTQSRWFVDNRDIAMSRTRERRALVAGLPSESVTLKEVSLRDDAHCWMCGNELCEYNPAHLDHLIPVASDDDVLREWGVENPGTVLPNMALACPSCNNRKSNRFMLCAAVRYFRNALV